MILYIFFYPIPICVTLYGHYKVSLIHFIPFTTTLIDIRLFMSSRVEYSNRGYGPYCQLRNGILNFVNVSCLVLLICKSRKLLTNSLLSQL